MNMQMHAAQFGQQFIPVAGMAMNATEQNASNVAGMIQDQNQRYMLQLQMQMQQGSNPQGMPPVGGGSGNQGNNASPIQKPPGEGVVGASTEKGGVSAGGQTSSVSRINAGAVGSPQLIPQQGSPIGTAAASSKKTAAKPKAKRASKKSAKGALASAPSTGAPNALAKSHPAPGNNDGTIAAHQRGVSAMPVNSALGSSGGQYNGKGGSAGSSIVSSSPSLTIKASSTPAVSGINMPTAGGVTAVQNASVGSATASSFPANTGAFSLGMNGQVESDAQHGSGSMPGFGENTFSALLSQKGNRAAMQANSGSNNAGGELDLGSTMNALGGVGGIDTNELSLHLSEWLNDSSADALTSILNMGVAMGGGDTGGGDHSSNSMSDPAVAAAAFSSFIASNGNGGSNNGGNGGGVGGFSSALTMPSMGGGSNNGAGGMGVPVSSVGGSNKGGEASNNVASMMFSPSAASGSKNM
ncbi:hypothetical protein EV178_006239 [Coemansia sp. RSA 1646]|nr:hypothetical protein EV178_006239 [Coemansia sp. RSA 1646]KAJ1765918.1 hypothetical protein LPJ74_006138 [Coemansia sp. RSA 1843]